MYTFVPRQPVKSFQDLEVYQKLENIAVIVVKRLLPESANQHPRVQAIAEKLFDNLLAIPVIIASAHSRRFGKQNEAILKLDEAMLRCNVAVVYLEQYRDLRQTNSNDKIQMTNQTQNSKFKNADTERPNADIIRDCEHVPADNCVRPEPREGQGADVEFFEEQVKSLLFCRSKLLHLQMSWKKFAHPEAH